MTGTGGVQGGRQSGQVYHPENYSREMHSTKISADDSGVKTILKFGNDLVEGGWRRIGKEEPKLDEKGPRDMAKHRPHQHPKIAAQTGKFCTDPRLRGG